MAPTVNGRSTIRTGAGQSARSRNRRWRRWCGPASPAEISVRLPVHRTSADERPRATDQAVDSRRRSAARACAASPRRRPPPAFLGDDRRDRATRIRRADDKPGQTIGPIERPFDDRQQSPPPPGLARPGSSTVGHMLPDSWRSDPTRTCLASHRLPLDPHAATAIARHP